MTNLRLLISLVKFILAMAKVVGKVFDDLEKERLDQSLNIATAEAKRGNTEKLEAIAGSIITKCLRDGECKPPRA
jgi:hypothetical protein